MPPQIRVSNIPAKTTFSDMEKLFGDSAAISDISFNMKSPTKPEENSCIITLKSGLQAALLLDKANLGGCAVHVEEYDKAKADEGKIPISVSDVVTTGKIAAAKTAETAKNLYAKAKSYYDANLREKVSTAVTNAAHSIQRTSETICTKLGEVADQHKQPI